MPNKCGSIGGGHRPSSGGDSGQPPNRGSGGSTGRGGVTIGPKLEPIEERRLVLVEREVVAHERGAIALERAAHSLNHLCVALIALIELCQRVAERVEKESIEARMNRRGGKS